MRRAERIAERIAKRSAEEYREECREESRGVQRASSIVFGSQRVQYEGSPTTVSERVQ
jgi:hypothetical protein